VGGGRFIDVAPRKHSRHDSALRESLLRRAAGDVLQEELRKYPRGVTVAALLKATLAQDVELERLRARRLGDWLFDLAAWEALAGRAAAELAAYHSAHPLRPGMAREELRGRLGVPPQAYAPILQGLKDDGVVAERGGSLAAPSHRVELGLSDGPAAELVRLLGASPFAPPSLPEALQRSGATPELVRVLVERGEIVRLSDEVAFTKDAYDSAVGLVKEIIASEGSVTVAQLRDRMGASRRPALSLLEHLDAQRVTRRVGDARVLR
ncbi:MAG TPA: SelB C-terminal domain-containing protein, partial [Candidatus Sulfotelmatobacter sp.]|nr:SelB C-terminal domain-containing protein [Candidatus Sulfotelmatobacter sp.]